MPSDDDRDSERRRTEARRGNAAPPRRLEWAPAPSGGDVSERAPSSDVCEGCGLRVAGGTAGCQAIADELWAREFTESAYFGVHRMTVDIYSLQHPDRYCASAKSLAAHLTGLCWLIEHDGSRATGNEALRRWLDGDAGLEKPPLPAFRGALTIADVRAAADAVAYREVVERWGRSTWDAYAPLHALAREWIRRALETPRRSAH